MQNLPLEGITEIESQALQGNGINPLVNTDNIYSSHLNQDGIKGNLLRSKKGFTLVELLTVVGIIGVLIAMLMPALSTARKKALEASCGNNERQLAVAATTYANDWDSKLPNNNHSLPQFPNFVSRLPIMGFDTTTIYNPNAQPSPVTQYFQPPRTNGFSTMMRDYLQNQWDTATCPDGLLEDNQILQKNFFGFVPSAYTPLPHRQIGVAGNDKDDDIARRIHDKPSYALFTDMDGRVFNNADSTWRSFVNHPAKSVSGYGQLISNPSVPDWSDLQRFPDDVLSNPISEGQNTARLDTSVTWTPFQEVDQNRYSPAVGHFYSW